MLLFFPSMQGKMGSYTTGNPTAATNPVSNYLIFIALNTSHQPKTHSLTPMHTTTEYLYFFFSFLKKLWIFFLKLNPRFVYGHMFNWVLWYIIYSAYSCNLFNHSSAWKHKGSVIWGATVYANIGMNTQLISVFASAHALNNLVEGYYV